MKPVVQVEALLAIMTRMITISMIMISGRGSTASGVNGPPLLVQPLRRADAPARFKN